MNENLASFFPPPPPPTPPTSSSSDSFFFFFFLFEGALVSVATFTFHCKSYDYSVTNKVLESGIYDLVHGPLGNKRLLFFFTTGSCHMQYPHSLGHTRFDQSMAAVPHRSVRFSSHFTDSLSRQDSPRSLAQGWQGKNNNFVTSRWSCRRFSGFSPGSPGAL